MISLGMKEEHDMIVNAVSGFAIKEMHKAARECDETGEINKLVVAQRILGFRSVQLQ